MLKPQMSKAEATRRVSKYRQGAGWIVSVTGEDGNTRLSNEVSYYTANWMVRDARVSLRWGADVDPSHYDLDGRI